MKTFYFFHLRVLRTLRGSAFKSSAFKGSAFRGAAFSLLLIGTWLALSFNALADTDHELSRATFAGGCFWCMEPPYDRLDGVVETISGFSGGHVSNPTYEQVVRGGTGHLEVVQVVYDPSVIDYATLLHVFWRNIDPYQADGQFCDRGDVYRSAIFVHDDEQARQAQQSLAELVDDGPQSDAIDTRILEFQAFYPAEEYHQAYYQKNPTRYRYYRWRCGRDQRLEQLWGEQAGGHP
jgi:peptide-methionine (S)-S-oxide reductase